MVWYGSAHNFSKRPQFSLIQLDIQLCMSAIESPSMPMECWEQKNPKEIPSGFNSKCVKGQPVIPNFILTRGAMSSPAWKTTAPVLISNI